MAPSLKLAALTSKVVNYFCTKAFVVCSTWGLVSTDKSYSTSWFLTVHLSVHSSVIFAD